MGAARYLNIGWRNAERARLLHRAAREGDGGGHGFLGRPEAKRIAAIVEGPMGMEKLNCPEGKVRRPIFGSC